MRLAASTARRNARRCDAPRGGSSSTPRPTGLDPERDALLAIGGVAVDDAGILRERQLRGRRPSARPGRLRERRRARPRRARRGRPALRRPRRSAQLRDMGRGCAAASGSMPTSIGACCRAPRRLAAASTQATLARPRARSPRSLAPDVARNGGRRTSTIGCTAYGIACRRAPQRRERRARDRRAAAAPARDGRRRRAASGSTGWRRCARPAPLARQLEPMRCPRSRYHPDERLR